LISNFFTQKLNDLSLYFLPTIVLSLGGFVFIPFLWNKLGADNFGIIVILEILTIFLPGLFTLCLDQYMMRFYYEWDDIEKKKNLGSVWIVLLFSTILQFIFFSTILQFTFFSELFFPKISIDLIQLVLVYILLFSINSFPLSLIRILNIPKLYALYKISNFLIYICSVIFFVFVKNFDLKGYYFGLIFSQIIMLLFSISFMKNKSIFSFKISDLKKYFRYSLPLIPAGMLNNSFSIIERFVLQANFSLNIVGFYAFASKFAEILNQVFAVLKLSYGPELYQVAFKRFNNNVYFYLGILFLTGLGIIIFANEFLILMNVADYKEILIIIPWLVINSLLYSINIFIGPGIIVTKKTELKLLIDFILVILFSSLVFYLINISSIIDLIFIRGGVLFVGLILYYFITKFLIKWKINLLYILINFCFLFLILIYANSNFIIDCLVASVFIIYNFFTIKSFINYETN